MVFKQVFFYFTHYWFQGHTEHIELTTESFFLVPTCHFETMEHVFKSLQLTKIKYSLYETLHNNENLPV